MQLARNEHWVRPPWPPAPSPPPSAPCGRPLHSVNACHAAVLIRDRLAALDPNDGIGPLRSVLGVWAGTLLSGTFGTGRRVQLTKHRWAMGPTLPPPIQRPHLVESRASLEQAELSRRRSQPLGGGVRPVSRSGTSCWPISEPVM